MKVKSLYSNLFELNLAVIFISTSGVLGRYIDLPVPIIIFMRALIACTILFIYCKVKGLNLAIPMKDRKTILFGGILLGIHWITYFYSLKLSNVAIGMLSLYTFPAITAFIEPVFTNQKFQKVHLFLAAMVLTGIYLLVPDINLNNDHFKAICLGIFSAICFSVRNVLLKSKTEQYNESVLMMNQLAIIAIILAPVLYFFDANNLIAYLPTTFLLAILTTVVGHTLFVYSLKNFSTISASLISSLQPVYGIILGVFFLSEYPTPTSMLGGTIIISTVVIESFRLKKSTLSK